MAETDGAEARSNCGGWRRLGLFWASVLLAGSIGGGVLQWFGPPESPGVHEASARQDVPAPPSAHSGPMAPVATARDVPGPIAAPDPMLTEPAGDGAKAGLPRIDRK